MDAITYLPTLTVRSQLIYTSVLVAIAVALASLPFIVVDVSVQASGLVRPVAERNEVKPLVAGRVAALLVRENPLKVGAVLLRLQPSTPVPNSSYNAPFSILGNLAEQLSLSPID
ncbi:hypothetical protein [Spirosoma sp. 209]|uniref:hypothetical protein n=1 Tax=Spirosoma sp. 209 TaxID=1955701 RepID=UPI00098D622A|nr:hypothetical protein [Spirosoma sp. 209]